jgi:hypothetical protein
VLGGLLALLVVALRNSLVLRLQVLGRPPGVARWIGAVAALAFAAATVGLVIDVALCSRSGVLPVLAKGLALLASVATLASLAAIVVAFIQGLASDKTST